MNNNTIQQSEGTVEMRSVSGVVELTENRAILRVDGYLPSPLDIHIPARMVRENALRRGDFVVGSAKPAPRGEQLDPLVAIETVNGLDPAKAAARPRFADLTPIYPNQRLRLETEPHAMTTRVTDLLMPIGKGQRALVVAPPKAGKTSVLQAISHGIAKNHPECELLLVLVGERPEEVTDLSREIPAEVAAATFDASPREQVALAELAIERAKRRVEQGRDVVVLLDSLTRLARAYNLATPASGRILAGGIDAAALAPPKKFLGAARNIEHGGSLTIIATALVETGSLADTVVFEEYKGTSNAELKLDRTAANRRVFPAVDIAQSSTRKDELLLTPDELAATELLRRTLSGLDGQRAIDLLLEGLRKTQTNAEFLAQLKR
ncbi:MULTISPECIES: transcription termination factor Rho, short form [unclassified Nocardia]|uniref:transcription termination factor Rho, short form n=1 Tax=unclassified Nocardia TaxID=2637762 RepID=UPI0027E0D9A2|nr:MULTISPECIES: transcription termination factor Rho [unclassified Nocardia]